MLNRSWIGALLALSAIAAGPVAGKPSVERGSWLVELVDPPTVERFAVSADAPENPSGLRPEVAAPASDGAVRGRFDVDSPAVRRYARQLDEARGRVLVRASRALERGLEPKFVYRHLHNGFAARMSAAEAARVAALPGVKAVRPDVVQRVHTDAGPEWIGATDFWTGATGAPNPNRGEGTVLGVIDTGVNWASIFFDVAGSSQAVVNPRGRFFGLCADGTLEVCNDKLIGIYDFTDEGSNGFDPDGHGSHVASTAVGLPLNFTLDFGASVPFETSGVAPAASFISYKACREPDDGDGGFICSGLDTAAALEQAITDGVDAVNYSIGGDPFDPWSAAGNQRVFRNLRAAGIVPVVSAGNDGPGEFTVASPANTPWVMAVANAHHGRTFANRAVDFSGGLSSLEPLVGRGLTEGTPVRPIVHARDFGNALCGIGPAELGAECADNTGASNPFAPGTFDGQIVVCDRGEYGRVEKGKNVLDAGAAGMILANTPSSLQSVVADEHCLPATHVDAQAGERLRDWLDAGAGHQGRLTGTERFIDDALSGTLRQSSSRGPAVGAAGVMKPNVSAPGTEVLAATTQINAAGDGPGDNAANQVGFLTGTSMASPHVAGAALLLRAAQPGWGVDAIVSALETTADPGIVQNADGSEARVIDRGAGGVRVDQAARVGLFLPVSDRDFLLANPAAGGDPGSLNLPGMLSEDCVGTCVFVRTVEALESGSWTVRTEGDLDVDVTPTSFTLSEGESRVLQIEVSRGAVPFDQWGSGSIVLESVGGVHATQRLPIGALAARAQLPAQQDFTSETNRGRADLVLPSVAQLDELAFRTSALVRPERREVTLGQDPTPGDPFDGPSGVTVEFVPVPPGALLLHSETFASSAWDIDLYVGRDVNNDGVAQGSELVCSSTSPDELERCDVTAPVPGDWWVLVQNWQNDDPDAVDPQPCCSDVPFEYAVLTDADDPSLVVTGPGTHAGGPLTVPVYWDQPAMRSSQRWFGAVALASAPDQTADIGVVPLTVTRNQPNTPADVALFEGETYTVALPGGAVHDRMFIDVPPEAEMLSVTVDGPVTDVTLRRRDFTELVASVPDTPPAPAEVLVQGSRSGETWTLDLGAGAALIDGGRYYVVVENGGPAEVVIDVDAAVSFGPRIGTPTPQMIEDAKNTPRRGLWGPVRGGINQGLDFQVGGGGRFAVWYTYDEQGRPTFYITDTVAFDVDERFFNAVLYRPTSNDVRSDLEVVGEVQITPIVEDRFMFAWRLNGNHGAEMFNPIVSTECPTLDGEVTPLLGHWFSPTTAAGGVTLLITAASEAWIRYYYDDLNRPRWVLADEVLQGSGAPEDPLIMEVVGFRGFCIYCTETAVTGEVIGTLERRFIDAGTVREVSDFVARPGVDASVDIDRQVQLLSDPVSCSN